MKPTGDASDVLRAAALVRLPAHSADPQLQQQQQQPPRSLSRVKSLFNKTSSSPTPNKDKQEMSGDEESGTTSNTTEPSSPSFKRDPTPPPSNSSPPKVARILFPPAIASVASGDSPGRSVSPDSPPPEIQTTRASLLQLAELDSLRALKEPRVWSVKEVGVWLSALGLEGYKPMFEKNAIRGADLGDLTDADLSELGVSKIGHKKVLLQSIADLTGKPVGNLTSRKVSPRTQNKSPRPLSPGVSPSPRPSVSACGPISPRSGAAGAPQNTGQRRELSETLYIKVRHSGKVALVETTRLVTLAELTRLCARAAGVSSVRTLHFMDADKELTLLKSEADLAFVLESLTLHTCNMVINK